MLKEYKLLRNVWTLKAGRIVVMSPYTRSIVPISWSTTWEDRILLDAIGLDNTDFFEKVFKLPKFKIGDYAVNIWDDTNLWVDEFIKIYSIHFHKWEYLYNTSQLDGRFNCIVEKGIRKPTQEELDIYFR